MASDLEAGSIGAPTEQPEGARKVTKTATDAVKRETSALAAAADHPQAATGLVFGISALAFTIGYLMGRSSATPSGRFWR